MLLANYSQLNSSPGTNIGGFTNPYDWMKTSNIMSFYYGNATVANETNKSSFNHGYRTHYAWVLAPKDGALAAVNTLLGSSTISYANLAGGLNAETTIIGAGDISAAGLSAIAYLIASLTSSGTLTADITGAVEMAASLAGNGDLSGALGALISILADLDGSGDLSGSMSAALEAVATMAGSGDLVGAIAGAVEMVSSITGSNSITGNIIGIWDMETSITGASTLVSTITAIADLISTLAGIGTISISDGAIPAYMEADITSLSTLSPENLAAAVWESIAAQFNTAGTMGAKMNSAASAGDPWSTALPGAYADGEAGKILAQIQTLVDELHKIGGLNDTVPVITTQTSIDAGTIHIDLAGDGVTSTTLTRND